MALSTADHAEPETVQPVQVADPLATSHPLHTLPAPFADSNLQVLTQGAEALVYKTTFLTPHTFVVVKYRPPKPYRHPTLDRRLTKARLLAEARVLVKCKREGVDVPAVIAGDWDKGWLVLEWVGGRTVRRVLDEWAEGVKKRERRGEDKREDEQILKLMQRVGKAVGKLHDIGVCHGDLTTSNLMLKAPNQSSSSPTLQPSQPAQQGHQTVSAMREAAITTADAPPLPVQSSQDASSKSLEGDIYLIDFGLATITIQDEDRAVDLYVLERAFAATHPAAEPLFQEVLRAYGGSYKGAKTVLKRLEGVRLRGRKRSMLG